MEFPALASAADLARLRNGFTIRHERRTTVGDSTRLFLASDNASFVDIPTASIEGFEKDDSPAPATTAPASGITALPAVKPQLSDVVQSASDRYRLDPDLVNSVIHAESGFNPHATSHKGAQGLMQLMPQTASKLGVSNRLDPRHNVEGGTRYLRELLELYNFDLVKALAAYNAGPHRVQQYRRRSSLPRNPRLRQPHRPRLQSQENIPARDRKPSSKSSRGKKDTAPYQLAQFQRMRCLITAF